MASDPNPGVLIEGGFIIAFILGTSLAIGSFALQAPLSRLHMRLAVDK